MKTLLLLLGTAACALTVGAQPVTDVGVLLNSYTRFVLTREVQAQAAQFAQVLPEADAQQIADQAAAWMAAETDDMRAALDQRFGNSARARFSDFVAEYTAAESQNDLHYLGRLAADAQLGQTPMAYPAMRRLVMDQWLQPTFQSGSRLLGEIQTWAEIRSLSPQTPNLEAWLNRATPTPSAPAPAQTAPTRSVNPLAAAEAPAPEWVTPAATASANPMDAFTQSRQDKRDRAQMDAQAGMQQMAMERQAVEQEYAAKKSAEAQADAEAMRAQAMKLAAVEQEAIDQRANSWMGRLKNIVSATVGAATGAFTGGIGAEAGRQAADALFNK